MERRSWRAQDFPDLLTNTRFVFQLWVFHCTCWIFLTAVGTFSFISYHVLRLSHAINHKLPSAMQSNSNDYLLTVTGLFLLASKIFPQISLFEFWVHITYKFAHHIRSYWYWVSNMCHEMLKIKRVENSLDSKSLLVNFQNIFACCEMTLGIFLKCLTFTSKKYYCGTSGEVRTQGIKHKITWKDFHKNKISTDLNLNGYNFLNVGKVRVSRLLCYDDYF